MTHVEVVISAYAVGGPYAYSISKNNVGVKNASGLTNIAAAWNAVRDDLIDIVQTETVLRVDINVRSS